MRPPTAEGVRPTVAVLMTTRDAATSVARDLRQLDELFGDGGWSLFVADDGSTDDTLERARRVVVRASPTTIVGFPAAASPAERLDRLVRLAAPWADRFEYALITDPRRMHPAGVARLLAAAWRNRQPVAVGDAEWADGGGPAAGLLTAGEAVRFDRAHPFAVVVETRLLPQAFGRAAEAGDRGGLAVARLWDDGVHVCSHGGGPVCGLDERPAGPRPGEPPRGAAGAGVRSICTIAFGPESTAEAVLMLRSFRLFNDNPAVVLCDEAAEAAVRAAGVPDIEFLRGDWRDGADRFRGSSTVMGGVNARLSPAAMLSKMDVISEAARRHGNTLFVDCDTVFLNPLWVRPRGRVMLSPELSTTAPFGWNRHGVFNGGCVFFDGPHPDLMRWWRDDFLRSWRRYGAMDQPTGCFVEQSSLDLFPSQVECGILPPSYNVCAAVLVDPADAASSAAETAAVVDPAALDAMAARAGLRADWGLWLNGWPVVSVHCHFAHPHWHSTWPALLRRLIQRVDLPPYRAIASQIEAVGRGGPGMEPG
ncbi:MAG TPA: glycosyltransferase [Mycobacterium sp.]|nr:glycosyltransferase [Mycobacterium sp.]